MKYPLLERERGLTKLPEAITAFAILSFYTLEKLFARNLPKRPPKTQRKAVLTWGTHLSYVSAVAVLNHVVGPFRKHLRINVAGAKPSSCTLRIAVIVESAASAMIIPTFGSTPGTTAQRNEENYAADGVQHG